MIARAWTKFAYRTDSTSRILTRVLDGMYKGGPCDFGKEQMTETLPGSFDPFAVHAFTNSSGLIPNPPEPSQYPLPISPLIYHTAARSSSAPHPVPLQIPQPFAPIASRNASNTSKPIFELFTPERASPELEDVTRKSHQKHKS